MRGFGFIGFVCVAVASAAMVAACGDTAAEIGAGPDGSTTTPGIDGSTTTPPASTGLPCDVDAVLAKDCRSCHSSSPQFGAPMPLLTHADLTAASKTDASKKVYELVAAKVEAGLMPPSPKPALDAASKKALLDWVAAGAPSSTATCTSTTDGGKTDLGVTCKPDLSIGPATPYEMPAISGEQYVCYGVELARPDPTHITAFVPRVDNAKIVHHIVLFEAPSAYSATPQECNSGGSLQWRMVMGWAPGAKGLELPPEAGFPIKKTGEGTTHYVVQMHYSNALGDANQKDNSGFDLCTGPPRANEADVMAFGTQSIQIPPKGSLNQACKVDVQANQDGIHLIAAMPHMHGLGTEMSTTLTPSGGGTPVDLGTDLKFSFQTQAWYPIGTTPQGHVVKAGDSISTRCKWVNPTNDQVKFGEKTVEEMCYSFTMYYPKVQQALWSWALPAVVSSCQQL